MIDSFASGPSPSKGRNRYRKLDGRDAPVFDELTLLEASPYETWRAAVVAPSEEDVDDLGWRAGALGVPLEDWTGSVRMLCERCSASVPHDHHGDELVAGWTTAREIAFAVRAADLASALDAWVSAGAGRSVSTLARVL